MFISKLLLSQHYVKVIDFFSTISFKVNFQRTSTFLFYLGSWVWMHMDSQTLEDKCKQSFSDW